MSISLVKTDKRSHWHAGMPKKGCLAACGKPWTRNIADMSCADTPCEKCLDRQFSNTIITCPCGSVS